MTWFLVAFGIVANAAASALVKTAGAAGGTGVVALVTNWRLILSLCCYGLAFLAYAAAVQRLPLNIAHPISTAGAIVLVGLISGFFFQETFTPLRLVGYGLLLAGIVALALAGTETQA